MTTQLTLFNDALALLGKRKLSSTSDDTEDARVLSELWDHTRAYCLEQGKWKFAERQAQLTAAVSPPDAYGLTYGFAKPSDFVMLTAVASDSAMDTPITFHEATGHIYSDTDNIYVRYISDDASYGYDLSLWTESFVQFYTYYLAFRAAPRIAPSQIYTEVNDQGQVIAAGPLAAGLRDSLQRALEFDTVVGGPSSFYSSSTTTKLDLCNQVATTLGLPLLTKLTDATETARVLLSQYDHAVDYCLAKGRWKWAEKQGQLSAAGAPPDSYGLTYAYAKPTDYITLHAIASDASLATPVDNYHEASKYFYSDTNGVYVQYTSNDASFGGDITAWPDDFAAFFVHYLALRVAPRLSPQAVRQSTARNEQGEIPLGPISEAMHQALRQALQHDVITGPSMFLPGGSTTQLSIFNQVATKLKLPTFTQVTDAREDAKVLLNLWDHAREFCLEQEKWKFATRNAQLSTGSPPGSYGVTNGFQKPTDFVSLVGVATDADMTTPVDDYHESGDYIYSESGSIYIEYVSKDASYGYDPDLWPESFVALLVNYLAMIAAPRVAPNAIENVNDKEGRPISGGQFAVEMEIALDKAKQFDSANGPSQFLPDGSTTQLSIFNRVVNNLGLNMFIKPTDAVEPARVLLNLWDSARNYCLEQGRWRFAEKQVQLTAAVSPPASYNLTYGFEKPADFVTLNAVATDAAMDTPVDNFHEAAGHIYSDTDNIYIEYTSNDASYGFDLDLWPEHFTEFVTAHLTSIAAPLLAPGSINQVQGEDGNPLPGGHYVIQAKDALQRALQYDTANGPSLFYDSTTVTKLDLFNQALDLLGVPSLTKITDASKPARVLISLYDYALDYCLAQGRWKWAEKQAALTADGGAPSSYGLTYGYAKPSDYITLHALAADASFDTVVDDFHDAGGHFFSNTENIYIQYTSNDASFGGDITAWPDSFISFFVHYLALRAAPKISPAALQSRQDSQTGETSLILEQETDNALQKALLHDTYSGPSQFLSDGSTTQLSIFNRVTTGLGMDTLIKPTDASNTARTLLNFYDNAKKYCLEQGRWRFAEKQTQLTAGSPPGVYGFTYGFEKPTDFVTLNAIATDAAMTTPVDDFHEAGGWIYSNSNNVYINYTSDDASFGNNLSLWPEHFTNFFVAYMIKLAAPRLAPDIIQPVKDENKQPIPGGNLTVNADEALQRALAYDAANAPSQFLPSATTKLSIFNNAMFMLGKESLVQLTDATEDARTLLHLWNRAVDYCLEQGHWTFAEREAELSVSVTEVPTKGYTNAYEKPSDFVRLNWMSADEYFNSPIFEVHERTDFWYTDIEPIHIRYVSNDASYGYDLTKWPETFTIFVTLYLATLAAPRLAPDRKIDLIRAPGNIGLEEAKYNALSKDASAGPTQFLPQGNWVASRVGRYNKGRNSNNSLYGS